MASSAAAIVLGVTLALLVARRVAGIPLQRGPTALFGGMAMLAVSGASPEQALAAVHLPTLGLVAGMLLLTAVLTGAGLFQAVAAHTFGRARTERQLVLAVLLGSAALSALVFNAFVALALLPLLFIVLRTSGIEPFRTLTALILGTNLGGMLTPVGTGMNAYVASAHGSTFGTFSLHMAPLVALGLVLSGIVLLPGASRARLQSLPASSLPFHKPALVAGTIAIGLLVAMFLAERHTGMPMWMVALMTGAMVIWMAPLLDRGMKSDGIVRSADGNVMLLFIGMSLLWAGASVSGLLPDVLGWLGLGYATEGIAAGRDALVLVGLGHTLGHVPTALLLGGPFVDAWGPIGAQYLVALLTLGGNALLVGSSTALLVAERCEAHGRPFGFWRFARYGIPVALGTSAAAFWYFHGIVL